MRSHRSALLVGLLCGGLLLLGCSEEGKPMKNMQPGTGAEKQFEIQTKGKKTKPEGGEPPSPQAPPR